MTSTENTPIRLDLDSSQASSYSSMINSSSRRAINDTSVDEIIHHESIESQSARNMIDFIVKQQRTIAIIVREAIQTISRERDDDDDDVESFDSFDFSKSSNQNDDNIDNNIKWNFANFDFFDSYYDDKSLANETSFIVNIDKDTYFRDVHLFIVRAKKMTLTRDEQLIKNNLWLSLKNIALKWWTDELSDAERRMTKMIMIEQKELSEWISLLHNKFKQSTNVAMNNLVQQRYTLRNVAVQREFREYAQKIIRLIKNVDMINVLNQLNLIYNDIDIDVRVDTLRRFKNSIIINEMLSDMNEFKHDWWAKAAKLRSNINIQNNRNQLFRQNARSQQFDQYNSNRQSQSQRQSFQFQSFQRQSFQSRYSNNVYQNQSFQPRQNYQQAKYQNYKSVDYQIDYSNNQKNQYSNDNVRTLSISSNWLQITIDSTNVNASNSNQQQFMSSRQSFKSLNNTQRNDYNDYDEYAQRSQTTYQVNVADETNENSYINDINDAHWLFEYQNTDDSVSLYENQSNLLNDYNQNVEVAQNVNFLSFATKISIDAHNCTHCNSIFTSRNQLFKHLRNECWFFDTFEHVNHAIMHDDAISHDDTVSHDSTISHENFIVSHADHADAVSIVKLSFSLTVSTSRKNSNTKTSRKKIYELSHAFLSINRRVIQSIVRSDETNSDYVFRDY